MTKVAVLYICIGKYSIFWEDFYTSLKKNLIMNEEQYSLHFFVFTDDQNIKINNDITLVPSIDEGWPLNTLHRYKKFFENAQLFKFYNILFFFNANLMFPVQLNIEEILPNGSNNFVAAMHPSYFNSNNDKFPYERRTNSKAYIPHSNGTYYFQGALMGGEKKNFLSMCKILNKNIECDKRNGIIAKYHDESHWNRFLIDRNDVLILDPGYIYPEGWNIPFEKRLISRNKSNFFPQNHKYVDRIVNLFRALKFKLLR
jgi:hypothetical protein